MESLLNEERVLSRQTGITPEKGKTFDSTIGSGVMFYTSFRMPL
jgi:hypothetical protein